LNNQLFSQSSRPIKDEEYQQAQAGLHLQNYSNCDGIAIAVNQPQHPWFDRRPAEDIYTGKLTNWNQVGSQFATYSRRLEEEARLSFAENVLG